MEWRKVYELRGGERFHARCFTEATAPCESRWRGLPVERLYSTGKQGTCAWCSGSLRK